MRRTRDYLRSLKGYSGVHRFNGPPAPYRIPTCSHGLVVCPCTPETTVRILRTEVNR